MEAIARIKEILRHKEEILRQADEEQNGLFVNYDKLKEKGLISLNDQLALIQAHRTIQSDISDLKLAYERAESFHYTKELADAIRTIELDIAIADARQQQLSVRAKQEGIVNQVFAKAGEYVAEGSTLAEISNHPEPVVHLYLKPERMSYARAGQLATIRLPNGSSYRGKIKDPAQVVEKIPASFVGPFEGSKRAIKVVIHFDSQPEYWIEGLPVEVELDRFILGKLQP